MTGPRWQLAATAAATAAAAAAGAALGRAPPAVDRAAKQPSPLAAPAPAAAPVFQQQKQPEGAHTPEKAPGSGDQLLLVQAVFRHGARAPLSFKYWPELNAVWDVCSGEDAELAPLNLVADDGGPRPDNEDDLKQVAQRLPGGCSRGQLTTLGHAGALHFGRWLRERYVQALRLLPESYEPGSVHGRSTNYSRTLATLRGVLAGLYPGNTTPVYTTASTQLDEVMFANVKSCQRLALMVKELHQAHKDGPEQPGSAAEKARQAAAAALGLPEGSPVSFLDLHDVVTSMLAHGKPVPEALRDPELLSVVEQEATRRFSALIAPAPAAAGDAQDGNSDPQTLLRLGMGRLMALLIKRMEAAAAGGAAARPRLRLYSGHDSTIMPLLVPLLGGVDHWPPYLSSLVYELWARPGGEPYVRVLYNREPLDLGPACGTSDGSCPLPAFRDQVLGPYLLTRDQQQAECLMHFKHTGPAGEAVEVQLQDQGAGSAESAEAKVGPSAV